uniref:FLYWCH-type domain-containing protein n=1 Tax=Cacopsylla melanoneura TaxID=428564 RepID=A0A8D8TIJ1_9HEMI
MDDFKIIGTRTKKILKYQNHVFKFNSTLSTRGKQTLWSCSTENCRAFVKIDQDGKRIVESNDKHEHNKSLKLKHSSKSTSSESDLEEAKLDKTCSPNRSRKGPISNDSPSTTKTGTNNQNTPILPYNILPYSSIDNSVLLVSTPGLNGTVPQNETINETPRAKDEMGELKRQVDGLIQVIIKKEQEIDRLKDKSEADEKDMADMLHAIRSLEESQQKRKQDSNQDSYDMENKFTNEINALNQTIAEKEQIIANKNQVIDSLKAEINQIRKMKTQNTSLPKKINNKNSHKPKNKINGKEKPPKPTIQLNETFSEPEAPTQEEHTKKKVHKKIHSDSKKKTYIILGDSQARNVGQHMEKKSINDELKTRSYIGPGADLTRVMKCGLECWQEELARQEENQLVLFAGTIDCFCPLQWKNIKHSLQILKQISEKNHVTIILVPYSMNNRNFNTNAYELNKYIWNFFKLMKNVSMIDTNMVLNNQKFYKYDKYHLNELGKKILARKIYNVIELKFESNEESGSMSHPVSNLY